LRGGNGCPSREEKYCPLRKGKGGPWCEGEGCPLREEVVG